MLMSDLRHDLVSCFVSVFDQLDWGKLHTLVNKMIEEGTALLQRESIPKQRREFSLSLDCRYVKQYHEVSVPVTVDAINKSDAGLIAGTFHAEHRRMYGYSLEDEGAPIELINVRLSALGLTEKPTHLKEPYSGRDPGEALKGERSIYVPEDAAPRYAPVFDGHRTRYGNHIQGPALVEQVNTTLLITATYDCICDEYGSFIVYRKGEQDRLSSTLREIVQ
jgi:N-methylhydantoinase A